MLTSNIFTMKDNGGSYKFVIDTDTCLFRAQTLLIKEKSTISWIKSFDQQDIFLDIGANIGIYTIFSSPRVKKVYAIEPHCGNFYNLLKNIHENNAKNIIPFSIGLHNKVGIYDFNYSSTDIGSSGSQIDTNIHGEGWTISTEIVEKKNVMSIDHLINHEYIEYPTHIKIDVDGNEYLILKGAKKLLKTGRVKSILVEYNPKDGNRIEKFMKKYNYILKERHLSMLGEKKFNEGESIHQIPHNMLFTK